MDKTIFKGTILLLFFICIITINKTALASGYNCFLHISGHQCLESQDLEHPGIYKTQEECFEACHIDNPTVTTQQNIDNTSEERLESSLESKKEKAQDFLDDIKEIQAQPNPDMVKKISFSGNILEKIFNFFYFIGIVIIGATFSGGPILAISLTIIFVIKKPQELVNIAIILLILLFLVSLMINMFFIGIW